MKRERNICHDREAVASRSVKFLQVVNKHDFVPSAYRAVHDVLHAPPRRVHQLDVALGDLALQAVKPRPLLRRHLPAVDVAEVDDRAVRDDTVYQLGRRSFEAVKADFRAPPHVRRHLERERRLAGGRAACKDYKIAEVAVQATVESAEPVLDEFSLCRLLEGEGFKSLRQRDDFRALFFRRGLHRRGDELAPFLARAHLRELVSQLPQAADSRLLLHSLGICFPGARRAAYVHALHQQRLVFLADGGADRYRVERPAAVEDLACRGVHRPQLSAEKIALARRGEKLACDLRVEQQRADDAVLGRERCSFLYHTSTSSRRLGGLSGPASACGSSSHRRPLSHVAGLGT